jgi:hypothetical protein
MIRDIQKPEVKNVTIAIARHQAVGESDEWKVYLINSNPFQLENVLVASKGYGLKDGEDQKTSTLRHFFDSVQPNSALLIEPIDPTVFHLNNEYWLNYYIGRDLYDKRFVFVPDSICEENLIFIKELETQGVLHS